MLLVIHRESCEMESVNVRLNPFLFFIKRVLSWADSQDAKGYLLIKKSE